MWSGFDSLSFDVSCDPVICDTVRTLLPISCQEMYISMRDGIFEIHSCSCKYIFSVFCCKALLGVGPMKAALIPDFSLSLLCYLHIFTYIFICLLLNTSLEFFRPVLESTDTGYSSCYSYFWLFKLIVTNTNPCLPIKFLCMVGNGCHSWWLQVAVDIFSEKKLFLKKWKMMFGCAHHVPGVCRCIFTS